VLHPCGPGVLGQGVCRASGQLRVAVERHIHDREPAPRWRRFELVEHRACRPSGGAGGSAAKGRYRALGTSTASSDGCLPTGSREDRPRLDAARRRCRRRADQPPFAQDWSIGRQAVRHSVPNRRASRSCTNGLVRPRQPTGLHTLGKRSPCRCHHTAIISDGKPTPTRFASPAFGRDGTACGDEPRAPLGVRKTIAASGSAPGTVVREGICAVRVLSLGVWPAWRRLPGVRDQGVPVIAV
jgi:hypothetical protein